uniref:Vacuolar protein-sorting-associated protein 25 n=1 Tax=Oryctolagus cuniculus TaxID=9986 RepID=A0A5F9DF27_RABIT
IFKWNRFLGFYHGDRFLPFFALQPSVAMRQTQPAAWCPLLLSLCCSHKQSSTTVMEAQEGHSTTSSCTGLRGKGNLQYLENICGSLPELQETQEQAWL